MPQTHCARLEGEAAINRNRHTTLLVVSFLCLAPMAHAQTFVNGTFDTDVPGNGTGGGYTSSGADNLRQTTGGNPGAAFRLNAFGEVATDPTLSQTVSGFTVGNTYRFSGDYASYQPQFGSFMALSFGVSVNGVLISQFARPFADNTSTAYKPFSVNFVAPTSTATITISAERNGDDLSYLVDNLACSP